MTWGELKKALVEKGVADRDEIWYIDIDEEGQETPKVNRIRRKGRTYIECTNIYETKKSFLSRIVGKS